VRHPLRLVALVVFALLFFGAPSMVRFYTDWLWFGEVGYQQVFTTIVRSEASLFTMAFVGMAPFGNLYGLPVYVDKSLAEDAEIVFNAGTHIDTIRIKYADFARLVRPVIIDAAIRLEMASGM